MSLYWFDKEQAEIPSYNPTLLFDRKTTDQGTTTIQGIRLKNPCCICHEHMQVEDMKKVVVEMVTKGWTHPGPGTIVCNKDSCRTRFLESKS